MSVSRDEVARIAALAALDVDEAAMPELAAQMSRILDYVAQLGDVAATPGRAFRPPGNDEPQPLRPDVAVRHVPPLDPRAFAPDVRDGLVVVPPIGGLAESEET